MIRTKTELLTQYNDLTTGQFKDAQAIPISRLRDFVQDITDSAIFEENVDDGPWKQERVTVKTTAALPACTFSTVGGVPTLTATANAALSVDGRSLSVGDTVLVSQQSTSNHNGVYELTVQGTILSKWVLTLRVDSRSAAQIAFAIYQILYGSTNANTLWKQIYNETGSSISNVAYEEFRTGGNESEVSSLLSSAGILGANSTPIQLVPTAGSGKVNVPIYFIVSMDYQTTPYDTNTEMAFQYADGTQIVVDTDFITTTSDKVRLITVSTIDGIINSDIEFTVNGGDPLSGDSQIRVVTKYRTITI